MTSLVCRDDVDMCVWLLRSDRPERRIVGLDAPVGQTDACLRRTVPTPILSPRIQDCSNLRTKLTQRGRLRWTDSQTLRRFQLPRALDQSLPLRRLSSPFRTRRRISIYCSTLQYTYVAPANRTRHHLTHAGKSVVPKSRWAFEHGILGSRTVPRLAAVSIHCQRFRLP